MEVPEALLVVVDNLGMGTLLQAAEDRTDIRGYSEVRGSPVEDTHPEVAAGYMGMGDSGVPVRVPDNRGTLQTTVDILLVAGIVQVLPVDLPDTDPEARVVQMHIPGLAQEAAHLRRCPCCHHATEQTPVAQGNSNQAAFGMEREH